MTQVTSDLLQSITDAIVETINPERVILFGSQARGDAEITSDIDLMVVTSEPFGKGHSRIKETGRLYRELMHFDVSKDLLLFSRDEVEHWKDTPCHVIGAGLREGRVLYERQ